MTASHTIKRSLRAKLVWIMLGTLTVVGISTTVFISWIQVQHTEIRLAETERQIRAGLKEKGERLATNHALALRNLVLDNAFGDVQSLVGRVVEEDEDVVYGLFLSAEHNAWAYVSPNHVPVEGRVDPDAWKELQLGDEPVPPKSLAVRQVEAFGDVIEEFAVSVRDEEEILGTIYYGVSTARMRHALALAREASAQALRYTLLKFGALVLLTTLVGLLVVLRVGRRITSPLVNLTEVAGRIAAGERTVRAEVRSGDEIEVLAETFNQMVGELAHSYRELEALNSSLEQKVKDRTAALASRNKDMRLVMDNAQQGFITVFADGTMAQERSAVVDALLGVPEAGETFASFTGRSDGNFGTMFALGLEMIVEDILPRDVCLHQLPKRARVGARTIEFHYVDISQGESFEGVLAVAEDITDRLAAERLEKEQAEVLALFRRMMRDRVGFLAFMGEADRQVESVCEGALLDDLAVFKRVVHTLKGNTGIMGLHVVAGLCHEIEDALAHGEGHAPDPVQLAALAERWAVLRASVAELAGDRSEMTVSESEYRTLLEELEASGQERLVERVRAWRLEPVSREFDRLQEQAISLAERLGRGAIVVEKAGGRMRLDPAHWGALWSDLIHVVRNCIDHGLYPRSEVPPSHGPQKLFLRAALEGGRFVVEIGDNGRGVDWDRIRAKAVQHGVAHETSTDLVEALFADGLSTRDEVSETSGRGVGMGALRATVRRLGGTIDVRSVRGHGTRFILSFPGEGVYAGHLQAA